jgi:nucleoside-diphosphate-sugar epimerase
MRVFVAGASEAIGKPLLAELLRQGHSVVGMTTSETRAKNLENHGIGAMTVDAHDAAAVLAALQRAKVEAVINELSSLPRDQSDMPKYAAGDSKLRIEGGGNLFRAALACDVRRYLQQSSGFFLKAPEGSLANESSPMDVNATPGVAAGARTYTELEARLFSSMEMDGLAIRYGFFYGTNTWYHPRQSAANMVMQQQIPVVGQGQGVSSFVHIEDAAMERWPRSLPSLASITLWMTILPRSPYGCRRSPGSCAPPAPPHMGEAEVRAIAGEDAVYYATKLSGASNAKAKQILGWKPRRLEWINA